MNAILHHLEAAEAQAVRTRSGGASSGPSS
jgi:hypothetical protein